MNFFPRTAHILAAFLIIASASYNIAPWQVINSDAQSAALQSKYTAKKDEINSQISAISSELSNLETDFHAVAEQKRTLKEEVAAIQSEIDKVNDLITQTKLAISQIEDQIAKNEADMQVVRDQLKQIIHTLQKKNQTSKFEILLTSKNFGEAMSSVYNLGNIENQARRLNKRLQTLSAELDANKLQQEQTQQTLVDSQYLLASKKDGLKILLQKTEGEEAKYQALIQQSEEQRQSAQANLNNVEAEYQEEIRKEAEEERRRKEEAERLARNPGGSNSSGIDCSYTESGSLGVSSDYFIMPTSGYVSQDYWCGGAGGHDGWDIANGIGTPINASAAGVVERTGYHPGGFGNFVVLRHELPSGGSAFTLYAHMNAPTSASGYVAQGQQIGVMGSTGWSTGPHLHFMIISNSFEYTGNVGCRYGDSKCYNPADYI